MTSHRSPVSAGIVTALLALIIMMMTTARAAGADGAREVFRFQDGRITESSGLAVVGDLFATVNDSGDGARVFLVDRNGVVVGVSRWSGEVRDVEALAPGADDTVWLGDIGDNDAVRSSVRIVRLPVGRGDRTFDGEVFELRYPDGPRDAESLAVQPGTGRVVIVSKELFGGVAYSPPSLRMDGPTTMRRLASGLLPVATDAAFLPDGRHVIVRNYTSAAVYRFPSWEEVGRFRLPAQALGEGLAVDGTRGVYISTEGAGTAVTWVPLPAEVQRAIADETPPPSATTSTVTGTSGERDTTPEDDGSSSRRGWLAGVTGGALVLLVVVAGRRLGRRR